MFYYPCLWFDYFVKQKRLKNVSTPAHLKKYLLLLFFPDVRKLEHIHTQSGQRECVGRRQQDEARIAKQNVRMLVGQYSIKCLNEYRSKEKLPNTRNRRETVIFTTMRHSSCKITCKYWMYLNLDVLFSSILVAKTEVAFALV